MRTAAWIAIGLASGAWALQSGKPFALRDKAGNFAIENMSSYSSEFVPGGDIQFDGRGKPVTGFSKDQGLTFSCLQLKGLAVQTSGGKLAFKSASAMGEVLVTMAQAGAGASKAILTGQRVDYLDEGGESRLTMPSKFTMTHEVAGEAKSRTVSIEGSSGVALFDQLQSKSADPLRSVEVAGPVLVRVRETRTGQAAGKASVNGRGDRLTYSRATRTLTLNGNVRYEGEDTPQAGSGFAGSITADVMSIRFNENFEVVSIKMEGAPGKAEMRDGGA